MKFKKPTKPVLIITVAVMLIVCIAAGLLIHRLIIDNSHSRKNSFAPTYETVLPTGKTIDDLGGWQRVNPTGNDPVFAYTDKVDNVTISVSQQPLPEALQQSTESKLEELAKAYVPTTVDGVKVYIGTSAKGPQSVLFTKNGLLVNIKSEEKISQEAWTGYIKSLSNQLSY